MAATTITGTRSSEYTPAASLARPADPYDEDFMSDDTTATKRRGCAPVLVFMLALFALIFGLVSGAGGLYAYLYYSADGIERLRIAEVADTTAPAPTDDAPEPHPMAFPLLDAMTLHDSLEEKAIRDHITANRDAFQDCYADVLDDSPTTRGEVDLQFSIHGSSGAVTAAVVRENETEDADLGRCLTGVIEEGWEFDAPDTSGVATVRFQTLFLPLSSH